MAMPTDLNTPILEGGLERIPFFNGRTLTAEDLNTEQAANATERRRLGRALGTGVVEGLFVRSTGESTTVIVESGRALAPSGRVVELPQRTEVSVVSEIDRKETAGTEGEFANCSTQHAIVTSGTGAYLLVLEPASGRQGRVPRTNLGGDGAAGECGAQYRIEGGRLRLVCLDTRADALVPLPLQTEIREEETTLQDAIGDSGDPDPATTSRLRNLLAHACLRTPQVEHEAATLYDTLRETATGHADAPVGPTDVQTYSDVGADAVPIGLLYWAQDRILFVDVWAARRRVHHPNPQRPAPATARRRAETEAGVFQFQAQVADLVDRLSNPARRKFDAQDYFGYLPPIGVLPEDSARVPGFQRTSFFEGLTVRDPVFTEGAKVRSLFTQALRVPPVDIRKRDPEERKKQGRQEHEFLWTYWIRQNRQSKEGETPSSPYLVFTSGAVPYAGNPQFDLARWDYSHYGPGVAR